VPPPVRTVDADVGRIGADAVGSLLRVVMLAGGTVLVVPESPNPAAVEVTPLDTWAVQ
jgi:hypothetical protein